MNSIERAWRDILFDIYKNGHIHRKDDAEIKEIVGVHKYLENPTINVLSDTLNMEISPSDSNDYLKNIASGNYDIEGYPIKGIALAEYVKSVNNKDKQGFVYTYPNRLQAHFINESGLINQIEVVVKRLSENLGTNRAVMILYDPDVDSYEEDDPEKLVEDIPCLNFIQVLVRDNILNLHVELRSNDIFTAYPSNMMLITYLGMRITEKLNEQYPNIKFGGIYYNCTSAHYYTDVVDDEMIEKIL